MKIVKLMFYYLLGVLGILGVSIAPQVFATTGIFDVVSYGKAFGQFVVEFFSPDAWVYVYGNPPHEFPIIDVVWDPFVYSMQILLSALIVGFLLAFLFAFLANFLPKVMFNQVKRLVNILESIPDLFIAMSLQLLTLAIFDATGIVIFHVATYDEKAYLAPIITLAILPMVSLFKILLLMIEEELLKDYVVLAKSKGMKKFYILSRHVLKNILPNTFYHSKVIVWGALSSQFVIERVFNVRGLSDILIGDFRPITIAVALILVFTPFFLFYQFVDFMIKEDRMISQPLLFKGKRDRWFTGLKIRPRFKKMSLPTINKPHPLRALLSGIKGFVVHMKNWKFAVGFLFFIVVISYSSFNSMLTNNHIDQVRLHYAEDGITLLSTPAHPPGEPFLLGSDQLGFSLWDQIVVGAKFTLIFAIIIALLRVVIGFVFGIVYAYYCKPRFQKGLEKVIDSIHFLPLSVIAYLLLTPIVMPTAMGFTYTFNERILLEIIILTFLVVPLTSILIGKEIKQVMQQEFIASAHILGGSKLHILRKHIFPHIGPRLTIFFGQQFIQVLLIFIHLGVFDFFFGGTFIKPGDPPRSITHEWSGLIGNTKNELRGDFWIVLWVLLAFMISIFAMQLIIQGVKEVQQEKVGVLYNKRRLRRNKNDEWKQEESVTREQVTFTRVYTDRETFEEKL